MAVISYDLAVKFTQSGRLVPGQYKVRPSFPSFPSSFLLHHTTIASRYGKHPMPLGPLPCLVCVFIIRRPPTTPTPRYLQYMSSPTDGQVVVADESHMLKSPDALRTRAVVPLLQVRRLPPLCLGALIFPPSSSID